MASAFAQSRQFPAPSSSTQDNDNTIRQASGSKPGSVDLPALQNASRILLEQLTKDAQIIPDLGETLTACMFLAFDYCIFAHVL